MGNCISFIKRLFESNKEQDLINLNVVHNPTKIENTLTESTMRKPEKAQETSDDGFEIV
jgi:hypothetical protein